MQSEGIEAQNPNCKFNLLPQCTPLCLVVLNQFLRTGEFLSLALLFNWAGGSAMVDWSSRQHARTTSTEVSERVVCLTVVSIPHHLFNSHLKTIGEIWAPLKSTGVWPLISMEPALLIYLNLLNCLNCVLEIKN